MRDIMDIVNKTSKAQTQAEKFPIKGYGAMKGQLVPKTTAGKPDARTHLAGKR